MKEWINERAKIHIKIEGANLYYTAYIIECTRTHITFIDKYNKKYTYKIKNIEEITLL